MTIDGSDCLRFCRYFALLMMVSVQACNSQNGNHLIGESSPYLLQHAHNPVDWYPWGEEALQKAAAEEKMLIISIGYSACHWCHVMEHESFEDEAVAQFMNEHFVSIKVDREERPDIDDVYMTACQLATDRNCGWPLNAFALPDGRPVWAGTYFPKKEWMSVMEYFTEVWKTEPEKLDTYADQLSEGIQLENQLPLVETPSSFSDTALRAAAEKLLKRVDFKRGGQKGSPKFPMPSHYDFLLRYHHFADDPQALEAVMVTLREMAAGGIYDQLGGGFARYSTDANWLVPHFEKMLYDNAQLVSLYSQAFRLTGDPVFEQVVEETLEFIQRELTSPRGGFYSSLDADSEGEEGKFYSWTLAEMKELLSEKELKLVKDYYQVAERGNWEEGKNILHHRHQELSSAEKTDLEAAKTVLFQAREKRIRPGLDDKILTAWNALMLKGYVDAYKAFRKEAYLDAALKNARFLTQDQMNTEYRLFRNYKDGRSAINAFLDDYVLLAEALLALYEVTFDEQWLETARGLTDYALQHFSDLSSALFYYTSDEDPPLVARRKEVSDNVIPASNSVMSKVLLQLGRYMNVPEYEDSATEMMQQVWPGMADADWTGFYSNWMTVYLDLLRPPFEVAIVGPEALSLQRALNEHYLPQAILLGGQTEGRLPLLKGKSKEGATLIYVCRDKVCKFPVATAEAALKQMETGWQD
jgi:uncharacterized protein YyaL (SSP411 family)